MAITLMHIGRTPTMAQFALDQFTEHYKTDSPGDVAAASSDLPQRGDAHPNFPFMFVTDRHILETPEKGAAVDIVYAGSMRDIGGDPVLPPVQHKYSSAIQTATSSVSITGVALTSPVTLQFYAQTSEATFWTYNAIGTTGTAPDPPQLPEIISLTCQDVSFLPGTFGVDYIIGYFFQLHQTDIVTPNETVAGKFWQNTEIKTVHYTSPLFMVKLFSGTYFSIFSGGAGYRAMNSLSLRSGTDTASITVNSVDGRGSITGFTVTGNSINPGTTPVILSAIGGSGTGAEFSLIHP